MLKRTISLAALLWFANEYGTAVAQVPYTYQAPMATPTLPLDGNIHEVANVWGLANSVPLLFHAVEGDAQNWLDWPPLGNKNAINDIFVAWQAVWMGNSIYVSLAMLDDQLDSDHFVLNPSGVNAHQDDGIHFWLESATNLTAPEWGWLTDQNYLVHNSAANYIKQLNEFNDFTAAATPPTRTVFQFGRSLFPPKWFVESRLINPAITTYNVGDVVWLEITCNDADVTTALDPRKRTLAWNTRGHIDEDENVDEGPWNRLGKMVLSQSAGSKVYQIPEVETFFQQALPVILTSFSSNASSAEAITGSDKANPSFPQHQFRDQLQVAAVADSVWAYWSDFNDAAVIWRAADDLPNKKVFLDFKVFDDFRDSSNFKINQGLSNDDAIFFAADLNNNGIYDSGKDMNVLIHNTGGIYQFTGVGENFDSLYTRTDIKVVIGPLGGSPGNWTAQVEVNLPSDFSSFNPDNTLRMEIGYFDADRSGVREHQLVWSTVATGVKPWQNFSNLGRSNLTPRPDLSSHSPDNHMMLRNYPNPFSSETAINFSVNKICPTTIRVFNLMGQLITTLIDCMAVAGNYQVVWNGTDANHAPIANGIYFAVMQAGDFTQVQKMVLMR